MYIKRAHDSVHWFVNDLSSRIIAETRIPSDRFHLGKLIYWSMKEDPEFLMQTDAGTEESETNRSALERSVRCAVSFIKMGLKEGDVIVLMGPNNIHIAIPMLAALFLGIKIVTLDSSLEANEIKDFFITSEPNIVFCLSKRTNDVQKALVNANLRAKIVTFDQGDDINNLTQFMEKNVNESSVQDFRPADFDPEHTVALLASTSGTTGPPKLAALTHKNLSISLPYLWLNFSNFPAPTKTALVVSSIQWTTTCLHYLFSPVLRYHRLQSSEPITQDVFFEIVNKYKPTYTMISSTMMTSVLNPCYRENCDITSFETILIGGSAVSQDLIDTIKQLSPKTRVSMDYSLTEVGGVAFDVNFDKYSACRPLGSFDYRLVDPETNKDIDEANVKGELWLRGPAICKGYCKNPEANAEMFTEDGWFKTGDIFYRDEEGNFYFVDCYKLLIKYKNNQISPFEIEDLIRHHYGVVDVALTSVPDQECGELAVACVMPNFDYMTREPEIKDLVKDSLEEWKQLRGGVFFVNELPMTMSTKVHRVKLKEMALYVDRK